MIQLPADQTLEAAIRADRVEADALDELAETLIRFYQQAPRSRLEPAAYRDGFLAHVRANRDELLADADEAMTAVVKKLHTSQLAMLTLDVDAFDARVTSARIVDGHGDLRPEHIYLTRPPLVMDCIEFSQQFRQLDVADELAFLAMECDRLQASWVGQDLLDRCHRAMSAAPSASLVAFYKVYRACVRAKVLQLRARQLEGEQAEVARRTARNYLELAAGYQHDLPGPILLVVGGLMGSGKSTLARRMGETLGIDVLSTDEIRHARFGASSVPAAFAGGHYSDDKRACVYQEMFSRAEQALDQGVSVVLDGSFVSQEACQRAAELSRRAQLSLKLRCVCPDDVARQRIIARRQQVAAEGSMLSEARPELYDLQKKSLGSLKTTDWSLVDTTRGLDEQEQLVLAGLRSADVGRSTRNL
jgi:predicted kinase